MDGTQWVLPGSAPGFPYADVLPSSPFRRPDWRWIVAQYHVDHDRRLLPPWSDDPWTCRAFLHLRNIAPRGTREAAAFELGRMAILFAEQLRAAQNPLLRIELEARLLTGDSCEQIAQCCGIDSETVDAFEHLFYDVRKKLKNSSYVLRELIGPKLFFGFSPTDVDVVWKLVAYQAGSVALDAVMDLGWPTNRPERLDEVARYFAQCGEAMTARQLFVSSLALQTQELGVKDLGNLLSVLDQLETTPAAIQPFDGLMALPAGRAGSDGPQRRARESILVSRRLHELAASETTESPVLPLGQVQQSPSEVPTDRPKEHVAAASNASRVA